MPYNHPKEFTLSPNLSEGIPSFYTILRRSLNEEPETANS